MDQGLLDFPPLRHNDCDQGWWSVTPHLIMAGLEDSREQPDPRKSTAAVRCFYCTCMSLMVFSSDKALAYSIVPGYNSTGFYRPSNPGTTILGPDVAISGTGGRILAVW